VKLDEEINEALTAYCRGKGLKKLEFVRQLITERIERETRKNEKRR
jgi:hypothetical protein